MYKNRVVVGLTEPVTVKGKNLSEKIVARIDTGATKSSIDSKLVKQLKLGPVTRTKLVKSASGSKVRPIIEAQINMCRKRIKAEFTVADRSNLKYKLLIGQNILKKGFIIDPLKEEK